ncbi:NAD-dependent epimerase/dehydratase family protein [Seohaeicola saemankumensis]|nr:NAD-dependent epimerase/dehydratase family protein [Seohaeicola saemankumensis]MCA0873501.1 NAD-dependent epimerase/dehydratase family protein [Seohaeicola saemankumensis]
MHIPRVLVLGATGRVGMILRKCRPFEQVLWQSRTGGRTDDDPGWIGVDLLGDAAGLARAARGCDRILCLAGVTPAAAARGADMGDNARLALAAVRAGAAAGASVLLSSSAAVYGNPGAETLEEDGPANPLSDYGRAKLEMEREAAALGAELDVPVTSLRIGNIAGVDAILGGWRPGFRLDRFADGRSPERSYIGPATLARVLGDLARAERLPPVLNVAAPGVVEMAALLDAAGLNWTPQPAPKTAIARVALSTKRLETVTEFTAGDSRAGTMVAQWRALETKQSGD